MVRCGLNIELLTPMLNRISPHPGFAISSYFWRRWRPILGNSLAILVMETRARCLENGPKGAYTGTFQASLSEIAESSGFSVKQAIRLLKSPYATSFVRYENTYCYNPRLEKRVRGKCIFYVELTDPPISGEELPSTTEIIAHPGHCDVHKDVPLREQPKTQNIRMNAPLRERPYRQNVFNNCNIYNNYNIATAAVRNGNLNVAPEKREQSQISDEERDLVEAVRKYFRNMISRNKIISLIRESSLDNVNKQLEWFPYRDNTWARKGPVAAFITYCGQELGEPEGLGSKSENMAGGVERVKTEKGLKEETSEQIMQCFIARRKRYDNPAAYDPLFKEIVQNVARDSAAARALFSSCFIGDISANGVDRTLIIDTPNRFCRDWLEKNYGSRILRYLDQKASSITRLKLVAESPPQSDRSINM